MQFTFPPSPGWSALHLSNADWGSIAVIVKQEWRLSSGALGPDLNPEGIVLTDTVDLHEIDGQDMQIIHREADTALFKTRTDVFYVGRGTEVADVDGREVSSASLSVGGVTRRMYQRSGAATVDPINLFGFENRINRIPGGYNPESFSFPAQGGLLFWGARRSLGFSVTGTNWPLTGTQRVEITTRNADMEADDPSHILLGFDLTVPGLSMTPFVWEGGSNAPSNWCRRAAQSLTPDTLTIDGNRVSVIWRGALPLLTTPVADLRRIDLKEAA